MSFFFHSLCFNVCYCESSDLFFIHNVFSAQCQCHAGWRIYKNNCYYFSTDQKSWLDANAYCLGQRSNLMSIQDIQERVRKNTAASCWSTEYHVPRVCRTSLLYCCELSVDVAENTNRIGHLLVWSEWPGHRGSLSVEWWNAVHRTSVVSTTTIN